ncbi:hypothetical protein DFH09DRAFT_1141642 [Mycena vulgaris]|nr:hypothetical protein DFH09DRAFT_1141642 [Mycena vulgaris]
MFSLFRKTTSASEAPAAPKSPQADSHTLESDTQLAEVAVSICDKRDALNLELEARHDTLQARLAALEKEEAEEYAAVTALEESARALEAEFERDAQRMEEMHAKLRGVLGDTRYEGWVGSQGSGSKQKPMLPAGLSGASSEAIKKQIAVGGGEGHKSQ